jgi:glycosyltransferase involved in cell wall biosynthesis
MNSSTTLSILVPAYNEQYFLQPSLERLVSLAESPLLERIQVIVVDHGSTDQTPAVLDEFRLAVSESPFAKLEWLFLRHEKNRGIAAATQTALSNADGELVVVPISISRIWKPATR